LTRTQLPALARLLGDTAMFAEQHWGVTPLHIGETEDTFSDVFSLAALEQWLAASPRRPTVRMVADGVNVDPSRYCKPTRLGPDTFADVVSLDRVVDCLNDGATLVAQSLHRVCAPVAEYAEVLERELSHRVQVNAYLTPPSATGLRPHNDGHDVVVVQLHGSKKWTVDGLGETLLGPGNRLYMPRGTSHSAVTESGHSLHLTIGIHPVTYRQIATRAIAGHAALSKPLPIGYQHLEHAELAAIVETAIAEARNALRRPDVARDALPMPPTRTGLTAHRLQCVVAADHLDAATVLSANRGVYVTSGGPDHVELRRPGGVGLRLPRYTECAVTQLLAASTAIDDLVGLDPESQLVLGTRLLRDGFVHPQRFACPGG